MGKYVIHHFFHVIDDDGIADIVIGQFVVAQVFIFSLLDPCILYQLNEFEVLDSMHLILDDDIVMIFARHVYYPV